MIKTNPREEAVKQYMAQTLENAKDKLPEKAIPAFEKALNEIVDGVPPKDVLGMSESMVEKYYTTGYHYYQSGKFKDALTSFTFLRFLDGMDMRFTLAIAATHHRLKEYDKAICNYLIFYGSDTSNPLPYYYMFDCFKNMNQLELARRALILAKKIAEKDPKYAVVLGRINLDINHYNSEVL